MREGAVPGGRPLFFVPVYPDAEALFFHSRPSKKLDRARVL